MQEFAAILGYDKVHMIGREHLSVCGIANRKRETFYFQTDSVFMRGQTVRTGNGNSLFS